MRTVSSNNTTVLPLGKQGENLAEKIIFTDPISWLKGYGPGTVQLLNQRPGENTPYPVAISEEGDGSYSWAVTDVDTYLVGEGKCELQYLSGGTVVKSSTWKTVVKAALVEPSDTPPESQQGWVDKVLQAGTDAQEAAKRAEDAAARQPYPNEETGTWWVWDAEAGAYKDTGISWGGSSVELDTTLKEAGKAADAAAVGERLSTLSEEIVNLPQPDWNQNDSTAADYIKNRPFYSETGNITVENAANVVLDGFPIFAIGDTVTVNVDGLEYSLVAYDDEGYTTIGDPSVSFENGEGQLGWNIYVYADEVWFSAVEAHTVSYLGILIHKIDDKFINIDGFVRTFDYYFKDYTLYKALYRDDGDQCTLYMCNNFILPKSNSQLFGFMGEIGFSSVGSAYVKSCSIKGFVINDDGSTIVRNAILGTDTTEMEQLAADEGYTLTTNPNP